MFCLFGKVLYIMVRIRVSDRVRATVRVRTRARVRFRICKIRVKCYLVCSTSVLHTRRSAPCGLRGCKNGPAPFPGRMSYKATKPGLVFVLYLSMFLLC